MRRATLLAALVLSACFNPDDIFPLKGALDVAGQPVTLARSAEPSRSGECTGLKPFKSTESDEAGAFTFEVFRAQSQQLATLQPYCFRAETTYASGTRVRADVQGLFGEIRLGRFPDWKPGLHVEGDELRFTPLWDDSDGGSYVRHAVEVVDGDGGVAWRQSDQLGFDGFGLHAALTADPRVIQEFAGSARMDGVYGELRDFQPGVPDQVGGAQVEAHAGERVPFAATRVPPSRGMTCDGFPGACPFTDGRLVPAELDEWSEVTVWFTPRLQPTFVVVRGLVATVPVLQVEGVQRDGGLLPLGNVVLSAGFENFDFRPLPDGGFESVQPPMFGAFPVDAGEPLRGLRLYTQGLVRLDELSVY